VLFRNCQAEHWNNGVLMSASPQFAVQPEL